MTTLTYSPKPITRWYQKISTPVRLEELVQDVIIRAIEKRGERSLLAKKRIRNFLLNNLSADCIQGIISRSLRNISGASKVLNILDLFPPAKSCQYVVDVLGAFRYGFGCHIDNGGIMWTQGSARRFNMNPMQCKCLQNILLWCPIHQVKKIVLGASYEAFSSSKLNIIITRAHSLTSLTVLQGADNNFLALVGRHCPLLQMVDVSHSRMVTDDGLQALFFKKPKNFTQYNRCTKTLRLVILMGTGITWHGSDKIVVHLPHTFMKASVPEVLLSREIESALVTSGAPYDPISLRLGLPVTPEVEEKIATSLRVLNWGDYDMVVDQYISSSGGHMLYFREHNSRHLHACMRLERNEWITSLDVQWRGFSMASGLLLDLHDIGYHFPHLKYLKARLDRVWNRPEPLLPQLETVHCWVFSEITLVSLLKSCPSVKRMEINISRFNEYEPKFTDTVLARCLELNKNLCKNFQEFEVRPCALTVRSLDHLLRTCPNIRRIGDLESWNVSFEEMKFVNQQLEKKNSPCLLTVMSFPPKKS